MAPTVPPAPGSPVAQEGCCGATAATGGRECPALVAAVAVTRVCSEMVESAEQVGPAQLGLLVVPGVRAVPAGGWADSAEPVGLAVMAVTAPAASAARVAQAASVEPGERYSAGVLAPAGSAGPAAPAILARPARPGPGRWADAVISVSTAVLVVLAAPAAPTTG